MAHSNDGLPTVQVFSLVIQSKKSHQSEENGLSEQIQASELCSASQAQHDTSCDGYALSSAWLHVYCVQVTPAKCSW